MCFTQHNTKMICFASTLAITRTIITAMMSENYWHCVNIIFCNQRHQLTFPCLCWNWVLWTAVLSWLNKNVCEKLSDCNFPWINELKLWETSKIQNSAWILFCFCAFMTIPIQEWFLGSIYWSTMPHRAHDLALVDKKKILNRPGVKLTSLPFWDFINVIRRKQHNSTDTMVCAHFRSKPIAILNKEFRFPKLGCL